jgi:hypothetical protein
MCVAEYHSYFVGHAVSGFAIWSHNANICGPYRGGPHNQTTKPAGDGLESHHMPAVSVNGLPTGRGPAIQMDPLDHAATSSNGKMVGSGAYRERIQQMLEQNNVRGAMATEIRDVRRAAQEISGTMSQYNQAMMELLDYAYGSGFLPRIH